MAILTNANPSIFVVAIGADIAALRNPTVPAVRNIFRKHAKQLRSASGATILAIARQLAKSNEFPPRLIGFELLAANKAALALLKSADIERWAVGLCDWGGVDLFGCTIAGQAWRAGVITDKLIAKWAKSPDRWLRRLALVATVPLNNKARGGCGDSSRTLKVCATLVADRDDMVVKAMSWALRELAKRDPKSVRQFLLQNGDRMAARVRREVSNKIKTGLKNPPKAV